MDQLKNRNSDLQGLPDELEVRAEVEKELAAAEKRRAGKLEKACAEIQKKTETLPHANEALQEEITKHKKTKQQLQQTNIQLAKLTNKLSQLKRTQKQVIQHERLAALGQMASRITHDFNNALTPILGYADLLLSLPDMLNNRKEAVDMLETIRSTAMQARDIVSRLQECYESSDEARREAIDLTKLIENIVTLTRPKWKEEMEAKGVSIRIKTKVQDMLPINGNRSQLDEVLTNLILNAVDAMPNGGTITILGYIHRSRQAMELRVIDTGTGMTEDVRRRSIEPFFTTKQGRGAGLGLSMAYGIVRRHNGSLEIQSAPGKGTTVIIQLPWSKPAVSKKERPPAHILPSKPLRILLIDDEKPVRDLIARYLETDNHTVELAASGDEGLQKFRKGIFDLVITDRAMPRMSGDQVAAAVKGDDREIQVILLTGFNDMMNDKNELPAGVDVIVGKPVTRYAFRDAIAKAMANRSL